MDEHEGKVAMQIGQCGFYARVWVRLNPANAATDLVTISAMAAEPHNVEEGWVDAAEKGVLAALRLSDSEVSFEITRIHGMPCDTNSTLVAIATMRAVWNAILFEPPPEIVARIETLISRSHELNFGDLEWQLYC